MSNSTLFRHQSPCDHPAHHLFVDVPAFAAMYRLVQRTARLRRVRLEQRYLSTCFADLYRNSVESAPLQPGDVVKGQLVGQRRPRSSSSRFYIVDFGLKSEAPFTAKEIVGSSNIGDEVAMPLLELEDDFNEPVFDFERRSELPSLLAERYELLTKVSTSAPCIIHGRFASFKKGGASVKVLGMDAFTPRHHVVALDNPVLGSYAPFILLSMSSEKRLSTHSPGLDLNPVVSSYGGFLFCVANLVGIDEAWKRSGGGSGKERLAYLRLLTRILVSKNSAVRRILPKDEGPRKNTRIRQEARSRDSMWLNDLSQGEWVSSKGRDGGGSRQRRPLSWKNLEQLTQRAPRQKAVLDSSSTRRPEYRNKVERRESAARAVGNYGKEPHDSA